MVVNPFLKAIPARAQSSLKKMLQCQRAICGDSIWGSVCNDMYDGRFSSQVPESLNALTLAKTLFRVSQDVAPRGQASGIRKYQ